MMNPVLTVLWLGQFDPVERFQMLVDDGGSCGGGPVVVVVVVVALVAEDAPCPILTPRDEVDPRRDSLVSPRHTSR